MRKRGQRKTLWLAAGLLLGASAVAFYGPPPPAWAGGKHSSGYEVESSWEVSNNDFSRAREKAVAAAMRKAVQIAITGLAGDNAGGDGAAGLLADAARYVSGYRFLDVSDNIAERTAYVKLEVFLFMDGLRKHLRQAGLAESASPDNSLVILIREKSRASSNEKNVWEQAPQTEKLLAQKLAAAGFHVLSRSAWRETVSDDVAMKAVNGDMSAALEAGIKAGADAVLAGNAVVIDQPATPGADDGKSVQVSVNLKAISASKGVVIAARSDFASASGKDELKAEAEAFAEASSKLSGFFADALRNFGKSKTASEAPPGSQPAPAAPLPPQDL